MNPEGTYPRRWSLLILLLILLVALASRGMIAYRGLPYLHHWDEPTIAARALSMLESGDLNPHFFKYGSLLIYLNVPVDVAHALYLAGKPVEDPASLADFDDLQVGDAGYRWQISHPSFYLWNRRLTALFGTASVLLVFVIARRSAPRFGDPRPALVAALLLAVLPYHIDQSSWVATDVPAATLALAAVAFSLCFVQDGRPRDLVFAAALVGFAGSAKYNMAPVLLAPAAALAIAAIQKRPGYRHWLLPVLVAVPAFCFLLGTPYALFDLRNFLDDAVYEVHHYLVAGHGAFSVEAGLPHLLLDFEELVANVSWPVVLLASVGLLVSLNRGRGLLVFAAPAALVWLTSRTTVVFHRNLVIVYPFLAIAFGLGVVWLFDRLRRRWSNGRHDRALMAIAWLLVLGLSGYFVTSALARALRAAHWPENRSLAVSRINTLYHAPVRSWERLLVASELHIHPLDLGRLIMPYSVVPTLEIVCRPEGDTVVAVPASFRAARLNDQPRANSLDALLRKGGDEIAAIGGPSPTWLRRPLIHPAVRIRRPWPPLPTPPVECSPFTPAGQLRLSGPAAVAESGDGFWLELGADSQVSTPFFQAGAGTFFATWHDQRIEPQAPRSTLRATIVRRSVEGGEEEIAEIFFLPRRDPRARRLDFDLKTPAEVALRLELTAVSGSDPGSGLDGREPESPIARLRRPRIERL